MGNSLQFDNSQNNRLVTIENPTTEQITAALQSRHHETKSKITITSRTKRRDAPDQCTDLLQIARCTRDRYMVRHHRFSEVGGWPRHLIDKKANSSEPAVRYTSSNGEGFTERFKDTVDFETAVRVAVCFSETDGFPEDVTWNRKFK